VISPALTQNQAMQNQEQQSAAPAGAAASSVYWGPPSQDRAVDIRKWAVHLAATTAPPESDLIERAKKIYDFVIGS
jgi:hypothetical protein